MKPGHIVVLGGTGFVGSHLVARLHRDGHRITVLSRNREKRRELGVLPGVMVVNAEACVDAGVPRLLQMSALRAGERFSHYLKTRNGVRFTSTPLRRSVSQPDTVLFRISRICARITARNASRAAHRCVGNVAMP